LISPAAFNFHPREKLMLILSNPFAGSSNDISDYPSCVEVLIIRLAACISACGTPRKSSPPDFTLRNGGLRALSDALSLCSDNSLLINSGCVITHPNAGATVPRYLSLATCDPSCLEPFCFVEVGRLVTRRQGLAT